MTPPASWSDEMIVVRIGNLLRAGVIASAVLLILGGVIHLSRHGNERVVDRRTFKEMPPEYSQPAAIIHAALTGRGSDGESARGRALIQLGLLLLIATPVLRVAFSIFAFARQRDLLYVIFPIIVLIVLLYGLFSGQMH